LGEWKNALLFVLPYRLCFDKQICELVSSALFSSRAFQTNYNGCAENRFQFIAQFIPRIAFFIRVVVEQIYLVNFTTDHMVLA